MEKDIIDKTMQDYVNNQEISGGALLIRRGDEILYENQWGYSKLETKEKIKKDSIYRMMSMTKCVTAVAVMICVEKGLLELDAPISRYIPEFADMKVVDDKKYEFSMDEAKKIPLLLLTFSMDKVKRTDANREITIRDLLSHSSGLQQGWVGLLALLKEKTQYQNLKDFSLHYTKHVLDFQPGTGTGYSPVAGFDVLGYLISVVSGMTLEDFIQKEICNPLEMTDTTFFLNKEQKTRLVDVYKRKKEKLVNVTGTKDDIQGILHQKEILFEHGCGGLYSTLHDYDHFGNMLLHNGVYKGKRILSEKSVSLLHTEAPKEHLEPEPGYVWGLGMKIRQDKEKGGFAISEGSYGWSGAFGTHFFVSPVDDMEVLFMTNRCDLNGSGSYISAKVEELSTTI